MIPSPDGVPGGAQAEDVVASQDERSHVDAAMRLRIGGVILQGENEELRATARRLVATLPADDSAAITADWLDAQTAI